MLSLLGESATPLHVRVSKVWGNKCVNRRSDRHPLNHMGTVRDRALNLLRSEVGDGTAVVGPKQGRVQADRFRQSKDRRIPVPLLKVSEAVREIGACLT